MPGRRFSMDLAKLAIAAAWADGVVQIEEVNTLKQLLLPLPELSSSDWRELEIYLDHPITDEELGLLLDNVLDSISTKSDRELVMTTLTALVESDGVVTDEEREMIDTVRTALDGRATSVVGAVTGLLSRAVRGFSGKTRHTVREHRMADYVENPVYFRLSGARERFAVNDETLRTACLAAGMMALVACVDNVVAPSEVVAIERALQADWGLTREDATSLAKVGLDRGLERLDAYRIGQSLRESTTPDERRGLMTTLYQIARADGLDEEDSHELRNVTKCLGLRHKDFIAAKLASKPPHDQGS